MHHNWPRISYRKFIMVPSIMVRCVLSDVVASVMKCRCVFLRVKVSVVSMRPYACLVSDVPFGKKIEVQQKKALLLRGWFKIRVKSSKTKASQEMAFQQKNMAINCNVCAQSLAVGLSWTQVEPL